MGYERLNLKTGQVITEEVFAHLEDGIEGAANAVLMTPILYADLVALRDAGKLKAGMFYRITDYVTTTIQENTQSAGHAFDVIVMATDSQTLSEEARAIVHEGDTYFTEAGANLAAWKVWYALDNDSARFAWADAENGKGVIYRLIDEWNNDCPYDFKNVIYNKAATAHVLYNPQWNASLIFGAILTRDATSDTTIDGDSYYAFKSVIFHGPGIQTAVYAKDENISDGILYTITDNIPSVSTNVFLKKTVSATTQYTFGSNDTHEDYSLTNCKGNILRDFVVEGILTLPFTSFGDSCSYNCFGNYCGYTSFGNSCSYNCFGDYCSYTSFGNSCSSNSFGNSCSYTSFGEGCNFNSFGNNCYFNSFGNSCSYNSFGNNCNYNSFQNAEGKVVAYAEHNSFGNGCSSVTLQNEATASATQRIQNYRIANGMTGKVAVTRGLAHETTIAKATDGTIKQFNLADLAN